MRAHSAATMHRLAHLIVAGVMPTVVIGQNSPARPTVAVQVTTAYVQPADSAVIVTALRRGLQADSVVEIVVRPPMPRQPIRGADYYVTAVVRSAGDTATIGVRVFNVQTSQVAIRATASASLANLADSLTAIGRRVARALANDRP